LFLDEVAEIPLDLQSSLLRVLERGEILPLGATSTTRVDVRIVSASHRDLHSLVKEGSFREDLLFRLAGFKVRVPPLRERDADALLLAKHFLEPDFTFSEQAQDALMQHSWPGNVRELRHVVEVAMALCPDQTITTDHLFPEGRAISFTSENLNHLSLSPAHSSPEKSEKERIHQALEACRWNRGEAARSLGMDRSTLWRKMKKHGIS
jgi:transcriptional regulator of acetoin/glycerol metabolism